MSDPQKLAAEAYPDGEYTSPAVQLAFRDAYARGYMQAKSDAQERLAEAIRTGQTARGVSILVSARYVAIERRTSSACAPSIRIPLQLSRACKY